MCNRTQQAGTSFSDGRTPETSATARRKAEHIRINLEEDVQAKGVTTGLERYRLVHAALPELDLRSVNTSTSFLGHRLQAPILASCMTGGVERAYDINLRLARAAQHFGCAMGVGSQRVAIEEPALAPFFRIRDAAPDIVLLANLGAVQLNYGYGVDQCRRAVTMVEANALVLHLNPLQEALQPEGNANFTGLLDKIERVCRKLDVPVIVKEVGWGISASVARQLAEVGVAAIDIAGAGGTSWSEVERHRAPSRSHRQMSGTFAGWGIPTADSLIMVRDSVPTLPVIASGGLRNGIDAAKVVALGATLAGFASPLLKAAADSEDAAHELMGRIIEELRISMFCCGVPHLEGLMRPGVIEPAPAFL